MIAALLVALGSALCFAAAATLQQREAARQLPGSVTDIRLLWRLAHRPWWVAGIIADIVATGAHVWALSLGSVALVQPVGVMGLLFAIPMVAVLRRQPVPLRDIVAALFVLAALVVVLRLFPGRADPVVAGATAMLVALVAVLALAGGAMVIGHLMPGRIRALILAGGAGAAFGLTAVLTRAALQMLGVSHSAAALATAAGGVLVLVLIGFLMLQNAYRAGHFAASLAVAVVADPVVAIIAGIPLLGEGPPAGPAQLVAVAVAAGVIAGAVTALVRSPAQLFTVTEI